MDSVRKTLIKEQRNRWEQLCNKHIAKAYNLYMSHPEIDMRNWKKRLKSKPINLTMKELRDTNIRQSYIDRLESKTQLRTGAGRTGGRKNWLLHSRATSSTQTQDKSPYAFRSTQANLVPARPKTKKEIITEWRPKPPPSHRRTTCHRPHLLPRLWRVSKPALPKLTRFMDQATQQPTPEQLAKLKQLKRPTAPGDSAIYVVNRTTREREK